MEFKIKNIESEQTLLKFLKKALWNLPLSRVYTILRKKDVKLNDKRVKDGNIVLKENDVVEIFGVGNIESRKQTYKQFEPTFDVIYEDDDKLIVYKPGGLVVHAGDKVNSLNNQVLTYLERTAQWSPGDSATFVPTHCHRLDKPTSGLIIYAKTKKVASWFAENINNKELIEKYYLCTVNGKTDKKFIIEGYISENKELNRMQISDDKTSYSRRVATIFKRIAYDGKDTLLEAQLLTGRKHQIRASLNKIKKPIIGDKKYGSKIPTSLQLESYKIVISGKTFKKSKMFQI